MKFLKISIILVIIAIVVAHCYGYKIYGSAEIYDNRPNHNSIYLIKEFISPNIILTTNDSQFIINRIEFENELINWPKENYGMIFEMKTNNLFIQPDNTLKSGIAFYNRRDYWCGNTFFPAFFPRRLPGYLKQDISDILIHKKIAKLLQSH